MLVVISIFIALYHQTIPSISAVAIGQLTSRMYVPSSSSSAPSLSMSYSTDCSECICYELTSATVTYATMNCFTDSHVCNFYTEYATNYSFQWNSKSNLYLFQFPSAAITVVNPQTTQSVATDLSCVPQMAKSGVLLNITNPTSSSYPNYTCYAYTWIASGSSATLSFLFRNDKGGWLLDNVSVKHGSTEMIYNGGFDSGDLTGWKQSTENGAYYDDTNSAQVTEQSGQWYYLMQYNNIGYTISQTFSIVAGDTYIISFWLTNKECCAPTAVANIAINANADDEGIKMA